MEILFAEVSTPKSLILFLLGAGWMYLAHYRHRNGLP